MHVDFMYTHDVVSYCSTQLDKENMKLIRNEMDGLSNLEQVEKYLQEGAYIPVLQAIWSEKDIDRRVKWLRGHSMELHGPLMYEQALAEFEADPTVETVKNISLPLIISASFRLIQDRVCSKDPFVYGRKATDAMDRTYRLVLDQKIQEYLNLSLDELFLNDDVWEELAETKLLETVRQSLDRNLPSPVWLGYHGPSVYVTGELQMHPSHTYKELRDAVAQSFIPNVSQNRN